MSDTESDSDSEIQNTPSSVNISYFEEENDEDDDVEEDTDNTVENQNTDTNEPPDNIMEQLFQFLTNPVPNIPPNFNMNVIYFTNDQMAQIRTEAVNLANLKINEVCVELIDMDVFKIFDDAYMALLFNDELFINGIYDRFVRTFGLDLFKYLYTYYGFYTAKPTPEVKQWLLNLLIYHYKTELLHRLITQYNTANMENVKVVLPEDVFETIKTDTLTETRDECCTICQCPFEEGNIIKTLKCEHYFHTDCIKTQLCSYSSKCPDCRTEVEGGKPVI